MIVELHHSLLSAEFQDATSVAFDALSATKSSVSNIVLQPLRAKLVAVYVPPMLTIGILLLTVQNKFLDIFALEQSCPL